MEDKFETQAQLVQESARLRRRVVELEASEAERRRVEAALRAERDRAQKYLDVAGVAIVVLDSAGKVVLINPKGCEILGHAEEQVVGQDWFESFIPERIRGPVKATFAQLMTGDVEPVEYFENPVLTANGAQRILAWHNTVLRDESGAITGTLSSGEDITERKQAAAALRESENRFRELAENIREVFWIFDWQAQKVLYVSPAYEEIWGRSAEALLQDYDEWGRSIHPDDLEYANASFQQILETGGGQDREYRIVRPDGTTRWILDRGFAVYDKAGTMRRVVGIAEDITGRKQAEEALKAYSERLEEMVEARTRELREAQEQLVRQERLAVLGQLAGGVSHELRNPLGAIKNATYFLNLVLEAPEPEVKEALEILEREIEASDNIISSLLDFARARPPIRHWVDVNHFVQDALAHTFVPGQVEVVRQLDEALPPILGDPQQLRQVFDNLIRNAVQAMPEGGRLTVRSHVSNSDGVVVSFTDTGVGIPEGHLEKIFEPLFTTKAKGIGLGLALTKTLVEGHGGAVEVESEEHKGSTFTVLLPRLQQASN